MAELSQVQLFNVCLRFDLSNFQTNRAVIELQNGKEQHSWQIEIGQDNKGVHSDIKQLYFDVDTCLRLILKVRALSGFYYFLGELELSCAELLSSGWSSNPQNLTFYSNNYPVADIALLITKVEHRTQNIIPAVSALPTPLELPPLMPLAQIHCHTSNEKVSIPQPGDDQYRRNSAVPTSLEPPSSLDARHKITEDRSQFELRQPGPSYGLNLLDDIEKASIPNHKQPVSTNLPTTFDMPKFSQPNVPDYNIGIISSISDQPQREGVLNGSHSLEESKIPEQNLTQNMQLQRSIDFSRRVQTAQQPLQIHNVSGRINGATSHTTPTEQRIDRPRKNSQHAMYPYQLEIQNLPFGITQAHLQEKLHEAIGSAYFVAYPHPENPVKGWFKTHHLQVYEMVKGLSGVLKIGKNTLRLVPRKFPRFNTQPKPSTNDHVIGWLANQKALQAFAFPPPYVAIMKYCENFWTQQFIELQIRARLFHRASFACQKSAVTENETKKPEVIISTNDKAVFQALLRLHKTKFCDKMIKVNLCPKKYTAGTSNSSITSESAIQRPILQTITSVSSTSPSELGIHYTFRIAQKAAKVFLWYVPGLNNPVQMIPNTNSGIFEYPVYLKANTAYHYLFSIGTQWFYDPKQPTDTNFQHGWNYLAPVESTVAPEQKPRVSGNIIKCCIWSNSIDVKYATRNSCTHFFCGNLECISQYSRQQRLACFLCNKRIDKKYIQTAYMTRPDARLM